MILLQKHKHQTGTTWLGSKIVVWKKQEGKDQHYSVLLSLKIWHQTKLWNFVDYRINRNTNSLSLQANPPFSHTDFILECVQKGSLDKEIIIPLYLALRRSQLNIIFSTSHSQTRLDSLEQMKLLWKRLYLLNLWRQLDEHVCLQKKRLKGKVRWVPSTFMKVVLE